MPDWLSQTRERLEDGLSNREFAFAGLEALEAAGVDTTGWREVLDAPIDPRTAVNDRLARELVAVVPGPPDCRAGHRVLVVLCLADAVICVIDRDDEIAPEIDEPLWRLTDDLGTDYRFDGFGGGPDEHDTWYSTAVPEGAQWLELSLDGAPEATFRVAL